MLKAVLPKEIVFSAQKAGLDTELMMRPEMPKIFVDFNKVISFQSWPGIKINIKEKKRGIDFAVSVAKGLKVKTPFHFCFGFLKEKGEQIINPEFKIGENAEISIIAHCGFPRAKDVTHKMTAKIKINRGARVFYREAHYHGENSGAFVFPDFQIENQGFFESEFQISRGTIGYLNLKTIIEGRDNSVSNLITKILGQTKKDKAEVFHSLYLKGKEAKGLTKMRAVASGGASVLMQGLNFASAEGARGHIDCQEIIIGKNSQAKAVPIVEVIHEGARVTHEAAVGRIDQYQIEALMAKGLTEEEAIDLIIKGLF